MSITTLSSRAFNQDTGKAKKAARNGPVIITERGRPSHVLLSIEEYQQITGAHTRIIELLAMPEGDDIEFEAPRLKEKLIRPADLR